MPDASENQVLPTLQRLFLRQWRSLPHYLLESWLWTHPGDEDAGTALDGIVRHQERHLRRLAELIEARGGNLPQTGYPARFIEKANYHYVALDFLLNELVRYQREALAALEADRARCAADPEALAVVDEILADERRHLQVLEKLAAGHAWPKHALPPRSSPAAAAGPK